MADTYTVERRTTIDAPPSAVFERIVDLHRWEAWSPWEDLDPELRKTYGGPGEGVGATYEWQGNRKAGEGKMEITDVEPDQHVTIALSFLKPFKSESTTTLRLIPSGAGTEVVWHLEGPATFMTKLIGIFKPMDKMIGPDFEKGLRQLKTDAEGARS